MISAHIPDVDKKFSQDMGENICHGPDIVILMQVKRIWNGSFVKIKLK